MKDSFNFIFYFFIYDSHTHTEREAETQAEGEAGSMHREPDVGSDPGSPGSRPGPKAGAKPLCHPGIPALFLILIEQLLFTVVWKYDSELLCSCPLSPVFSDSSVLL